MAGESSRYQQEGWKRKQYDIDNGAYMRPFTYNQASEPTRTNDSWWGRPQDSDESKNPKCKAKKKKVVLAEVTDLDPSDRGRGMYSHQYVYTDDIV